jgi:SET domain-containing protein
MFACCGNCGELLVMSEILDDIWNNDCKCRYCGHSLNIQIEE